MNHTSELIKLTLWLWLVIAISSNTALACSFNMGWEPWKPYQYKNDKGQLTGLDIELVKLIVDNMGCQLHSKQAPWKRQLNETKEGKIDLLAGASMTDERKQWAYFTAPYRQETRALFVRKGESTQYSIHSLQDLVSKQFKLGITHGVYNGEAFKKMMQNPAFKKLTQEVSSENINPKKLIKGRIHGYIADAISGTQT